jgi:two-component system response regulator AtoC
MAQGVTVTSMGMVESSLLVIAHDRAVRHPLVNGELVIGRAEDCGLRIDDASVSRAHARLEVTSEGITLIDLGSHNGTHVNGRRVAGSQRVASGDVIAIGEATLILYLAPVARREISDGDIALRLEAEVDRSVRYGDNLAMIAWQPATAASATLVGGLLRRCDSVGLDGDSLVGVFPGFDDEDAEAFARQAIDVLRVVTPDVRAAIALCPDDGADSATLLAVARDALASTRELIGRAEHAVRRIELGNLTAIVADPGMVRVHDLLRRLAPSDITVLVAGETGVGKEIAARALHVLSRRAKQAFVAVNCAAIPANLVESELFGYKRGAFTGADRDKQGVFEAADGGTLFLDEVGELSLGAQAKLLRAIETRSITRVGATEAVPIDLRVVAASNRDLSAEVAAGRFRTDLYYRLNAAIIAIPPLRDRPREIPVLARAFLAMARTRLGRPPLTVAAPAMQALLERRYPGNLRELANTMEYAAAVVDGTTLEPWHLPADPTSAPSAGTSAATAFRSIAEEVAELERRRMKEALTARDGNQSQAADLIGMPRRTFVTKLKRYGLR